MAETPPPSPYHIKDVTPTPRTTITIPITIVMDILSNVTANLINNLTQADEAGAGRPGPLISLAVPLLMCCTGALGNVLALVLLWRSRRENGRSVFYRLVAGLAVTDLFGIIALSPVTILTYSNNLQWVGGQATCHYYSFVMIFAGLATVLLVLCMAVERCLAILSPYFYERHVAPERVKALLATVWTLAVLISSMPLVSVGRNVRHYPGTWCFFDYLSDRPVDKAFSIVYASIGLLVIAATAVCNVAVMSVLLRMRRVSQNIGKSSEGRTLTNMTSEMQMIFFLAGIILVFATCYSPLMVRVIINVSHTVPANVESDLMAIRLASINQILDPWVYLLFRRRLAALLYSACRTVSPLHKTSLRALKSEFCQNSTRNSPATVPKASLGLGKLKAKKHGSDASLALMLVDSPKRKKHCECRGLKADSLEEGKHGDYLSLETDFPSEEVGKESLGLKTDSPQEKGHEDSMVLKADSPTSMFSSGSQESLIVKSDCNGHCTPEVVRDADAADSAGDARLLEADSLDGQCSDEKSQSENGEVTLPASANSVVSKGDSELSSAGEQSPQEDVSKTSLDRRKILPNLTNCVTITNRNSDPPLQENDERSCQIQTESGTSNTELQTDCTTTPDCGNTVVPNGTSPTQDTNDQKLTVDANAAMTSSASWPVVCRRGNQTVIKMDDGDRIPNGLVWKQRHSAVEPSCTQCKWTSQDLSNV